MWNINSLFWRKEKYSVSPMKITSTPYRTVRTGPYRTHIFYFCYIRLPAWTIYVWATSVCAPPGGSNNPILECSRKGGIPPDKPARLPVWWFVWYTKSVFAHLVYQVMQRFFLQHTSFSSITMCHCSIGDSKFRPLTLLLWLNSSSKGFYWTASCCSICSPSSSIFIMLLLSSSGCGKRYYYLITFFYLQLLYDFLLL